MSLQSTLENGLVKLDLSLDERQMGALLNYLKLLEKWNKTYNLTGIDQPERMLTHHIFDSLAIAPYVTSAPLLDVGSGGGFPGIPLAIVNPDMEVSVMDASQKKCTFMQQVVIDLNLPQVNVIHTRVETYHAPKQFLQVVSRAFSELTEFVNLTKHLLAPGGHWLAMKGTHPSGELARLKQTRVVGNWTLSVPGLDAERCLIIMEPS